MTEAKETEAGARRQLRDESSAKMAQRYVQRGAVADELQSGHIPRKSVRGWRVFGAGCTSVRRGVRSGTETHTAELLNFTTSCSMPVTPNHPFYDDVRRLPGVVAGAPARKRLATVAWPPPERPRAPPSRRGGGRGGARRGRVLATGARSVSEEPPGAGGRGRGGDAVLGPRRASELVATRRSCSSTSRARRRRACARPTSRSRRRAARARRAALELVRDGLCSSSATSTGRSPSARRGRPASGAPPWRGRARRVGPARSSRPRRPTVAARAQLVALKRLREVDGDAAGTRPTTTRAPPDRALLARSFALGGGDDDDARARRARARRRATAAPTPSPTRRGAADAARLNEPQAHAVRRAPAARSLVRGPPGTGTVTAAALVARGALQRKRQSDELAGPRRAAPVLAVAHSTPPPTSCSPLLRAGVPAARRPPGDCLARAPRSHAHRARRSHEVARARAASPTRPRSPAPRRRTRCARRARPRPPPSRARRRLCDPCVGADAGRTRSARRPPRPPAARSADPRSPIVADEGAQATEPGLLAAHARVSPAHHRRRRPAAAADGCARVRAARGARPPPMAPSATSRAARPRRRRPARPRRRRRAPARGQARRRARWDAREPLTLQYRMPPLVQAFASAHFYEGVLEYAGEAAAPDRARPRIRARLPVPGGAAARARAASRSSRRRARRIAAARRRERGGGRSSRPSARSSAAATSRRASAPSSRPTTAKSRRCAPRSSRSARRRLIDDALGGWQLPPPAREEEENQEEERLSAMWRRPRRRRGRPLTASRGARRTSCLSVRRAPTRCASSALCTTRGACASRSRERAARSSSSATRRRFARISTGRRCSTGAPCVTACSTKPTCSRPSKEQGARAAIGTTTGAASPTSLRTSPNPRGYTSTCSIG